MEVYRRSSWLLLLFGVTLLAAALQGVQGEVEPEGPSESECRPYIEKALKEMETVEAGDVASTETGDSKEDIPTVEITDDSDHQDDGDGEHDTNEDAKESTESGEIELSEQEDTQGDESAEGTNEDKSTEDKEKDDDASAETDDKQSEEPTEADSKEDDKTDEATDDDDKKSKEAVDEESIEEHTATPDEAAAESTESAENDDNDSKENKPESAEDDGKDSKEDDEEPQQDQPEDVDSKAEDDDDDKPEVDDADSKENADKDSKEDAEKDSKESKEDKDDSKEDKDDSKEDKDDSKEDKADSKEDQADSKEDKTDSKEDVADSKEDKADSEEDKTDSKEGTEEDGEPSKETADDDSKEKSGEDEQQTANVQSAEESKEDNDDDKAKDSKSDSKEDDDDGKTSKEADTESDETKQSDEDDDDNESEPVEDLTLDIEIPTNLRPREHVEQLLKLDDESSENENIINKMSDITLRELKKLYENAIKPLEVLYKYRDLSNRHFGDSEIFSKPLILFMGPWSGGKSSIINYLVNNEYNQTSLRTGAEPSPAYFNILMYGDEPEVIDGTELAADYTFSGLQKFGQGLEERLRGVKLPTKLLEKVNIVEIPGILEVRKQVSRVFPFNDACQWFIDRADIIFLVYDPSKLDVGPETEAILDQLKGREHQTRIVLNKADQVKPEELMRVQGALIWNISPLMSSPQPPIMYTTSLWSRPYESWAPVRLLQAQERAFLRDLRSAVDKRIENKIASARRFAVRVRNHAKMVDCYLTTYYNHKSVFGNRKQVADEIIEHPQDYHIYEGLSTLTNISRYDLPDPDVYKDFFKLNPLYDFQQLSATCTYFRGCPINRLDVAIAYDLPELVGTHRRLVENALAGANPANPGS